MAPNSGMVGHCSPWALGGLVAVIRWVWWAALRAEVEETLEFAWKDGCRSLGFAPRTFGPAIRPSHFGPRHPPVILIAYCAASTGSSIRVWRSLESLVLHAGERFT
jgi:hypothetical protein